MFRNRMTEFLMHFFLIFVETQKMLPSYQYIIVGAGIAGIKAAETIRQKDGNGTILLINGEDRLPYKRTSISKRLAKGFELNELSLKPADWFDSVTIELFQGRVSEISLQNKSLRLENQVLTWNKLILCTGARPAKVRFKDMESEQISYFRDAADADTILQQNIAGQHILLIGGGVQGIEMAEQMLRLGNFVTLIHREKQLMNRYFDQEMADYLLFILQDQGVKVVHSVEPVSVRQLPNQQFEVSCSNGESYPCDKILANIGAKPDIELAQAAGLKTGTGILVDQHLQSSHPDVYAAGDVAEHSGHLITGLWHSAEQQGIIAGANAAGNNMSFRNLRYRLKIEVFGYYFFSMLPLHGMQLTKEEIIRKGNKYYHLFLNDGRLIGMLSMNDKDRSKLFETAVRNSVHLDEFVSLIE